MAFLARQVQAANFNVTTTADACAPGGGCLRDDIGQSNTAGGANSISWQAGSGGTITLGSDLAAINANTTLDVTNAPSAVTIAGPGAVPLGGAVTFNNGTPAQPWTISAVISGVGSLIQTGPGTLVLTGINTYSGGTSLNGGVLNISSDAALGSASGALTFNGGTLQAAAAIFSARGAVINTTGTFDTNGNSIAMSGGISGGGALIKNGAGTLLLSGSNSYSGGTVLNAGTLSLDSSSPLGSGGVTFNGGTLQALTNMVIASSFTLNAAAANFDVQGNTATLSGVIGGTGALTMVSTGTLALTGVNTYSGGTNLNAAGGVLNINGDAALGTSSVTFNGGTLQAGANIASSRNMVLGAAGGTIDTNSYNMILSGIISGAAGGGLTKVGGGMLTLGGLNTYNGATTVNGGTLQLGVSNALPAGGALTVASGAIFDMNGFNQSGLGAVTNSGSISLGAGTLGMSGYSGAGTLQLLLQNSVTNMTVAGGANLTGGTMIVSLPPQPAKPQASYVYTPITTTGGIGGALPSVVSPAAISFTPSVVGNNLVLTGAFVPFANIAATPNQTAIGNVLEPLRANPAGDSATVLGNLYALDAAHVQAALDQISPVSLAAMSGIGLAGASVQSAAVSQRMAALADGSDHGGFSSYTVSRPSPYPGTLTASALGDTEAVDQNEAKSWGSGSPWGFFTAGVVTGGRLGEGNSGSGTQPGYAFNTGGLTAGADYRLSDHLAVGASGGYLHGHASIYAPGSGTVSNNSARFGVYATSYGDGFHADLYLGGAADFFSTSRGILFGGISRTASGQPRGTEFNAHPGVSYDARIRDWGTFSPFAGLNYDRLMVGSFAESGADSLDLSVGPQTAQSLQSSLGLRWSDKFESDSGTLRPYVSLGWKHEFEDQSRPINAQLAGGGSFSVMSGSYARDGTLFGTGLLVAWGQATIRLDYSGDFRSHFQDSTINTSLRLKF